jgi:hypothetical protein
VHYALNNRWNNTAQDLRKEFIGGRWDLVCYIELWPPCPNHKCIYSMTI